jgi:hypothetical protein
MGTALCTQASPKTDLISLYIEENKYDLEKGWRKLHETAALLSY